MRRGCRPPSEVLSLQRFNGQAEPWSLGTFHSNQALRPQGFAPSRRFAPRRTFRVYFTPVPLLGFAPSRNCSCVDAPVLSDCLTLLAFHVMAFDTTLCLQGFPHRSSRARPAASYSPAVLRIPSWGFAPSRSLASSCPHPALREVLPSRARRCAAPLVYFRRIAFSLATRFVLQGLSTAKRTGPLSRSRFLHEVIHLVSDLYPKGYPQALGSYAFPRLPQAASGCHQPK
jgi:hypothetical protein